MKVPLIALVTLVVVLQAPTLLAGHAGPGTHYGAGNDPEGCGGFNDDCYHMRVGLNNLDTPVIDVLLTPPISPYPERDLRVMQQVIDMWDDGIHFLAQDMGFDWLADGVEFSVFVDDQEFTTHPAWDPEIVVVLTNPVGGIGIGIDPLGLNPPCRGANPLADFEAWEALPGFQSHHEGHSGTYVEECEGDGTTCYAVIAAIDPLPGVVSAFGAFYVTAHEVGHCLSIGHVGDGLDFKTRNVPDWDIMSYDHQGSKRCVSTLDVEGFAIRMSRYLLDEPLVANSGNYHTQHPDDHWYASSTRTPQDCPTPNWGLVPGEHTDFWPEG